LGADEINSPKKHLPSTPLHPSIRNGLSNGNPTTRCLIFYLGGLSCFYSDIEKGAAYSKPLGLLVHLFLGLGLRENLDGLYSGDIHSDRSSFSTSCIIG